MRSRALELNVPVSELLSPELWRQRYAYGLVAGVPPTDGSLFERLEAAKAAASKAGAEAAVAAVTSLPDAFIRWHLRAALSEVEVKLGLPMGVRVYRGDPIDDNAVQGVDYDVLWPRQPYTTSDVQGWYRIALPPSVVSVERVRAYYFGNKVLDVSGTEIQIQYPRQGQANLLPITFSSLALAQGGWYGAGGMLLMQQARPVPNVWAVDFTTGPVDRDGQPNRVPAVLAAYVYAIAGMGIFAIEGLARSKGITSASLSMDGVSRSLSFASGGQGGGINGAVEAYLEKVEKRIDINALRTSMRGLRIVPFGY